MPKSELVDISGILGALLVKFIWNTGNNWKLLRSSLAEIAARDARKLGRDWQVQSFSGGVRIDGQLAWDEGLLLLKLPSSSDRNALAGIHTAAQVKVAKNGGCN